jgi:hypothetical protein
MNLDLLYFFSFLSFLLFGLGYFIKNRWVAFSGSTLLLLLSLIILIPVYETGGIHYANGKNITSIYSYDEFNRTANVTNTEVTNYTLIENPYTTALGLIYLLMSIYLMYTTVFDRI